VSANLAISQVVQINLTAIFDGQRCMCTFAYSISAQGAFPPKTVLDLMTAFDQNVWCDGLTKGLAFIMVKEVKDVRITGQVVVGPGSRSVLEVLVPAGALIGQGPNSPPLPSGAAACISRKGKLAGPQYQGRIYVFGIPSLYVTASELNDQFMTDYLVAAGGIFEPIVLGAGGNNFTCTPCLHAPGQSPLPAQIGLTGTVHTPVRYQRRREVGVGQ